VQFVAVLLGCAGVVVGDAPPPLPPAPPPTLLLLAWSVSPWRGGAGRLCKGSAEGIHILWGKWARWLGARDTRRSQGGRPGGLK
jgi:hypothetical protein